ncbi:MAG: UDP-glucose 4-epimerase GalE, partial [Actinobacteria bacterium]|nr:UDP-glucose 4-epimerase GalE [Actinomycetota bacterium]
VEDLADAHRVAVDALEAEQLQAGIFNVGRGEGVSVLELLSVVERTVGRPVARQIVARRRGDPAIVVADVSAIAADLRWTAARDIDHIVASAWHAWRSSLKGH